MSNESHTVYFNTRDELTKVCLDDVMYAVSDGNYIMLKFRSNRTLSLLASMQSFSMITETVADVRFVRVGRSHVVNMAYVSQVNCLRHAIVLVDDQTKVTMELIVPKDAIHKFRQMLTELPRHDIPEFHTANCHMEAFQIVENKS